MSSYHWKSFQNSTNTNPLDLISFNITLVYYTPLSFNLFAHDNCFCPGAWPTVAIVLVQVLYVMELRQDLDKGKATFTAVSEFLLTHPVLSFGVRDVAYSRLRHTEVLPAEEESENLTTGVCASGLHGNKNGLVFLFWCLNHSFTPTATFLHSVWCVFAPRRHSRTHRVQVWNPNQTLLCTHQVSPSFFPLFSFQISSATLPSECLARLEAFIPVAWMLLGVAPAYKLQCVKHQGSFSHGRSPVVWDLF